MVQDFRWPGFAPEQVWGRNKALNEPEFTPLHFLHARIGVAGPGRKYKGTFRLVSVL